MYSEPTIDLYLLKVQLVLLKILITQRSLWDLEVKMSFFQRGLVIK